jgi:hypothetical protein
MITFFTKQRLPQGIIETYAVPYETDAEFQRFWPRLTRRERERLLAYRTHNMITDGGIAAINAFYTGIGSVGGFALYFAVGTGSFNGPAPGDTSLANEVYRLPPSSNSVVGNTIYNYCYFSGTQGGHVGTNPVTYSNCGLYGGAATSTLNSGTLFTHASYQFSKPYNQAITNSYKIIRT